MITFITNIISVGIIQWMDAIFVLFGGPEQ